MIVLKKQFKAESKKLLDLMINSIYTNKEIFLRELISNASDAIDKLYYLSLTNKDIKIKKNDLKIQLVVDKEKRTLTISDNGIGMSKEELEENLGTIAKSGSSLFKEEMEKKKNIDIIGQFGVGFYSSFMVANKVVVTSRRFDSDSSYTWESEGVEGYSIKESKKDIIGTEIVLTLKEEEEYNEFLEEYKLRAIVKKYSDYISYPITMMVTHRHKKEDSEEYEEHIEEETLNSMIPLWKKDKKSIKEEDYQQFYHDKFFDYENSLKTIHSSVEGKCTYTTLLYIPSHAPYDFYTKEYEKGLQLYANGVLIMDKCKDLLPDYFSFVKGLVDTSDLSLNISREMLQQDKNLGLIASNIEKKIKRELETMLEEERENYEKFFKAFGMQIKFGIYNSYGMKKEDLQDLLLFYSSSENKLVTLKEYVSRMKEEQDKIYYACGETVDKIDMLPQVEQVKEKGYEVLYLTEYVDEFVMQVLNDYEGKKFTNVSSGELDLDSKEEKEELQKKNEQYKDIFTVMKDSLKDEISDVRLTHRLKNHPVCLVAEGNVSLEMEKVMNAMPTDEKVKAKTILEINANHEISKKIEKLYKDNKQELEKYTKVLYAQARLIEGLPIENPTEISNLVCEFLAK